MIWMININRTEKETTQMKSSSKCLHIKWMRMTELAVKCHSSRNGHLKGRIRRIYNNNILNHIQVLTDVCNSLRNFIFSIFPLLSERQRWHHCKENTHAAIFCHFVNWYFVVLKLSHYPSATDSYYLSLADWCPHILGNVRFVSAVS